MWVLGFFDHGEMGEFRYFSLAHVVPILIMLGMIYLLYRYGSKLREWKHEETLRIVFAIVLLLSDMSYFWHKMYIGADIANHLPVTVCGWAAVMGSFMLMTKKQWFFDVVYFFVLAGSINALITPAVIVDNGPTHFRYYQFWVEHTGIFISVFYMLFVFQYKINLRSLYRSAGMLLVLTALALYVNANIEGANYLFLATTEAGESVLDFLPSNLALRMLLMGSIIGVLYGLAYLPWVFLSKQDRLVYE
jgi:hypothetical integral membrane protein (TIGR02206 family)